VHLLAPMGKTPSILNFFGIELATSAVTALSIGSYLNYATRMAPKVAVRNPKEQLSDHEWTKKWTLPQSGRNLIFGRAKQSGPTPEPLSSAEITSFKST
jgi:hypothetical protein